MNLPTVERQILTKDGDVVDAICFRYYGFTDYVTELVYKRNQFLSREKAILPDRLLLILPIVTEAELAPVKPFWPVKEQVLYVPESASTSSDPTASGKVVNGEKACCSTNVASVESADWVGVYIQNELGDWVLRRIHKSKLYPADYGYGAMTVDISVDDDPAFTM